MTQKDYQKAVCLFEPDPSMRERVAAAVNQVDARPRRARPLRPAFIAAALCLVLLGTAFAATAIYRVTVRLYAGEDGVGYSVAGEITRYPMERFSPELRAACESWGYDPDVPDSQLSVERRTKSRKETQAFLGEAIPLIWPDARLFPDVGSWFLLWQNLDSRELEYIYIGTAYRPEDNLTYDMVISVYPENFPADEPYLSGGLRTKPEHGYVFELLGEYVTANGHTAELVAYHIEDWPELVTCSGYFLRSGISYQVSVDYFPRRPEAHVYTQEEVLDHLCRLLDSFPA